MKAKAIVFREANKPLLEEIEIPELNSNEIRVKIEYSGVSIGTESSIFSGIRTHNGTFPLVGGYMASGIVEEIGSDVSGFSVGDRVIAGGNRLDGEVNSVWGGHSSMQTINQASALKVPSKTKMSDASMYVLPNVGLNAVTMANITEHDTVLIQGQGLIGQFFGQWVKNRGAKVITIEPDKIRAGLSKKYVTECVLDPVNDDLEAEVNKITDGQGPTIVVEATASGKLINNATKFLQPKGKMIFLSWYPGEISLDFSHFHNNEIIAFFPMGSGNMDTTRATLECLGDGSIVYGDNITDLLPYENACEGYLRIVEGDRSIMGMVVDWTSA